MFERDNVAQLFGGLLRIPQVKADHFLTLTQKEVFPKFGNALKPVSKVSRI
jgi:hypothetical protein